MNALFPRSPYDKLGGLVYLARMLDKIRLHEAKALPPAYHENLGGGFDARCCAFLGVNYADLRQRTLAGGTDEDVFAWCAKKGRNLSPDDIEDWNDFMIKRGWRDAANARLKTRLKESNFENRQPPILTFFDYIEVDEQRTPPVFA